MTQQMLVIAHYPDGETRDVTRDAIYTSSASEVATVTDDGFVTAVRRGETSILTRYEGGLWRQCCYCYGRSIRVPVGRNP